MNHGVLKEAQSEERWGTDGPFPAEPLTPDPTQLCTYLHWPSYTITLPLGGDTGFLGDMYSWALSWVV